MNELEARVAALESIVADLQRQTKKLFQYHGPATWEPMERQRLENIENANIVRSRQTFTPSEHFGEIHRPKPHEVRQ
jgi:hypothetical protein